MGQQGYPLQACHEINYKEERRRVAYSVNFCRYYIITTLAPACHDIGVYSLSAQRMSSG